MTTYMILMHPGHNRVYLQESVRYAKYEFEIVSKTLSAEINGAETVFIADIPYLKFQSKKSLEEKDFSKITRLSFFYALFEQRGDSLIPIAVPNSYYLDSSLSGMLKYSGKTNEIFTRLLLNVAVTSSKFAGEEALKILDPIAGKGTTLFECASMGYDAYGIEIAPKTAGEVFHFFRKYLETEKCKHTFHQERVSGPKKSFMAERYSFQYAKSKEEFKRKEVKNLEIVAGNTDLADKFFKKDSFHVLAGDLPYGVQHRNTAGQVQGAERSPLALLKKALPAWKTVMKKGGVLALSWNTFVAKREDIEALLIKNGFQVESGDMYKNFVHRVDQAILRDFVVAYK
jgi:Predicted DNA modification methylase